MMITGLIDADCNLGTLDRNMYIPANSSGYPFLVHVQVTWKIQYLMETCQSYRCNEENTNSPAVSN
jgi:hypothetical protein